MTTGSPTTAPDWTRPLVPASGPVRFARYAFGPNRLGYCGPDAASELFGHATRGEATDDRGLRDLAHGFEGAWPYLELIASSAGRSDPLDPAVVEAYWLGGGLVGDVRPRDLGGSLEDRFRPRVGTLDWRWLAGKPEAGAVPVHAFHVLDVFPRVGLMRTGSTDGALSVMDACRIRWGRVERRDGDFLEVAAVPLELVDGKLRLGAARPQRVRDAIDGIGFVDDVRPGDVISIHWDWACERLDAAGLAALRSSTIGELMLANATI
ncbi:MAG TPA: DUF6390 family protein [Candidatus Limnocylindrales bacterium]|nr:DUF6390 family protein [Candidatus Limnocylindrales bacterium]